jgi:lipoprotein NlpI
MKLPALVLIVVATLSLGGCASLIQTASISEAYKHYNLQQYERTLALISQAENADAMSAEKKAELTYLKAKTYERLGKSEIAYTHYEYLAREHGNSQYGYLAVKQLNAR